MNFESPKKAMLSPLALPRQGRFGKEKERERGDENQYTIEIQLADC